jgi:DNA-binding transcriptional LysR family regulator
VLIDYELLQTLVDIDGAGSFAAAAARRHVTTSAVSQRVKLLEHQLGFRVCERIGRRSRLTPAGQRLAATVRAGFQPIDEQVEVLRGEQATARGVVRVVGPPAFSRLWLRPRVVALRAAYPELLLDVRFEVATLQARDGLRAGEHDFAVLIGPLDDVAGLEARLVFRQEFRAVGAPAYLKRHGVPRTARELAAHPFIVFDEELAMLRPWWQSRFGRSAPLPSRFACRVASLDEMLALVEAGLGLSVLPNFFVDGPAGERRVQLIEPAGRRRVGAGSYPILLAWRRGSDDSARMRAVRDALLA